MKASCIRSVSAGYREDPEILPTFPDRFGSIEDARLFGKGFFDWYNNGHRHWGIGLMAPSAVHYGRADKITAFRRTVLATAFKEHPERFAKGLLVPPTVPDAAWINKPRPCHDATGGLQKGT